MVVNFNSFLQWFGSRHIAGEIEYHPGSPAWSNPGGVGTRFLSSRVPQHERGPVTIGDKRSLLSHLQNCRSQMDTRRVAAWRKSLEAHCRRFRRRGDLNVAALSEVSRELCDQPHQLINRQCKDAEHQVAEHLGVAAHPHIARTEIILDAALTRSAALWPVVRQSSAWT
jgi:hypothetical protein